MPSDSYGDDAHHEPEVDNDSDATQATPGDPGATQPSPEVGGSEANETTSPQHGL
jgi:hypothetical protein